MINFELIHYVERYLTEHNWLKADIDRVDEKMSMMRCNMQSACPELYNAISDAIDDYCYDYNTDIDTLDSYCSTDPEDYFVDIYQD